MLLLVLHVRLKGSHNKTFLAHIIKKFTFFSQRRSANNNQKLDITKPTTSKSARSDGPINKESMFIKQRDVVTDKGNKLKAKAAANDNNLTPEGENQSIADDNSEAATRSIYRTNYPFEFNPHALEDNFFKSLESKKILNLINLYFE